ncbi:hypothetical protein P154DRAFT_605849, partial [Amniculicola lignicola CBS 123094]
LANGNRIHVGNIPYSAQKSDVGELFDDAGYDILYSQNIDISIDAFTCRNPSYCFVDLNTAGTAAQAIGTLNGRNPLGRPLKIKPCIQKRQTLPYKLDPRETFVEDRCPNRSPIAKAPITLTTIPLTSDSKEGNRSLYVGGLPKPQSQHTSDLRPRDLFRDFNVTGVSKVKSPRDILRLRLQPGNRFYAFVDLLSGGEAKATITALHGRKEWGGRLKVRLAKGEAKTALLERAEEREEMSDVEMEQWLN